MKRLILITCALALTACASGRVEYYAVEMARHKAEEARWTSMAKIAEGGDTTAKAVALAVMGGGRAQSASTAAPVNEALQWASILAPTLTQVYGIAKNADVAIASSNNAAATNMATTAGFVSIAGKIQAPGAITTTTDRHDSIVTTPAPVVIPDTVQITPVVVPDTVVITPIAQPVTP